MIVMKSTPARLMIVDGVRLQLGCRIVGRERLVHERVDGDGLRHGERLRGGIALDVGAGVGPDPCDGDHGERDDRDELQREELRGDAPSPDPRHLPHLATLLVISLGTRIDVRCEHYEHNPTPRHPSLHSWAIPIRRPRR